MQPDGSASVEQERDLAIARRLAAAGVPVFAVPPNPAHPTGFALPRRWQHTKADPRKVDEWQQGWALIAVMGHGVDLVDVDPRNGGELEAVAWLDVVASASTPSGGEHLFIPSVGERSRDGFLPGIDYKGGADGTGHGFAFIAPTMRISKDTGEPVAYRWTTALQVERIDTPGSGRLAELVRTARTASPAVAGAVTGPAPASPWHDLPDRIERGERHAVVHRLTSALRGRGGWRAEDASRYLEAVVWPRIVDDGSFSLDELHAAVDDVFTRYPDGHVGDSGAQGGLQLRRASDVKPEPVRWLWDQRVALGVLTLLVGRAGLGKTTLAVWIAARVTRGQLGGPPADVLLATAEDSPAHTLVPRLIAAGADLTRVHFVTVQADGIEGGLTIPDDLDELEQGVTRTSAALVILDPVNGHLSGRIDSHRDHDIRRALGPVAAMADRKSVAVLGISHLNKAPSSDVLDRLGGSVGYGAAARGVLLFSMPPDTEPGATPDRVVVHGKTNLGALAVTLRFAVEAATVGDGIATSTLVYKGEAPDIGPAAVLTRPTADEDRSDRDLARETILDQLDEGERSWADLAKTLAKEGILDRTARRARDDLRRAGEIDKRKDGRGPWVWFRNLTTPLGQVPPGQVQEPNEIKAYTRRPGELVHVPETGQVPPEDPEQLLRDELGAVEIDWPPIEEVTP